MKKNVFLFLGMFLISGFALAQQGTPVKEQVKPENTGVADAVSAKTRGNDPNISVTKEDRMKNPKAESKVVQPADKGGNARGFYCAAAFDNYTSYYIDCYVDGNYEGVVAPYGDGAVAVQPGNTRLYAVAEFNDGSRTSWGPLTKYCGGDYIFTMEVHDGFYRWSVK